MRELSWRTGRAGVKLTDAEVQVFGKTGLRPGQGMKTYDHIRMVQHILNTIGHSLIKYQLGSWTAMRPGSVRYWCSRNQRWFRTTTPLPTSERCAGTSHTTAPPLEASETQQPTAQEDSVELDAEFTDFASLPLLLMVLDQASTGWAAAHFLASPQPGGMGLHIHFMGDPFHRSWNDFKWACSRATGHLNHSMIQMTICYNANYGPWMKAAFMLKKREALMEFIALHSSAEARSLTTVGDMDWEASSALVAEDAREGLPTDTASLQQLFDTTMLTNTNFLKKGPYVKMCAWYSILEAIDHYDNVWTSWKHLMQWLATNLMPRTAADARDRAVAEITSALEGGANLTAAQHKQQLMQIKRAAGNVLLLTPLLLTSENLFNMRLLLLVGRPLWVEQSLSAAAFSTGQRQRAIDMACGAGLDFCKSLWHHATSDARELARLGVKTTRDSQPYPLSASSGPLDRCVPEAEMPERIWSLLMHVIEARLHSVSWHQHGWPGRFAMVLDPARSTEGCHTAEEAWEVFTTCEALSAERPGIHRLLQEVYWLKWTVNQVTFRGLAHHGFHPVAEVTHHLERMFGGLGDTKLIEDTHKEIRSQEDQQSNQAITQQRVYHTLTRGIALGARGIDHVQLTEHDWQGRVPPKPSAKQLFHASTTKLPKEWGCENVLRPARSRAYTSKSPAGARASIGAAQALNILFKNHQLDLAGLAWQSCALFPRTLVGRSESTTALGIDMSRIAWHLVLTCSTWAAMVWPATALDDGVLVMDLGTPWHWITITDVEQWHCLPATPCINTASPHRFGFLALQPSGAPLPLLVSAMVQTKDRLLAWQRKAFCQHFGCTAKTAHEQEAELCAKLMAGHPDATTTLAALERVHGQGPEIDDTPEELEALTAAAFQELDAEEQEQWKAQGDKYKQENSAAHQLAKQVLDAARQNLAIDEEADDDNRQAMPQVKEVHNPLPASSQAMEQKDDADRLVQLRSNIPFVGPYVPGGPGTTELPSSVSMCRANRVERTQTWVARYECEDKPAEHDAEEVDREMNQVSKSKNFGPNLKKGASEHQAFQHVIQWLWKKHHWHNPGERRLPAHVEGLLMSCQHCMAKERVGKCPIWAAVESGELPAPSSASTPLPEARLGPASAKTGTALAKTGVALAKTGVASARTGVASAKTGVAAATSATATKTTKTNTREIQALQSTAATPVRVEVSLGLASATAAIARAGAPTPTPAAPWTAAPFSTRAETPRSLQDSVFTLQATEGTVIRVPQDGNCLFASMSLGVLFSRGKTSVPQDIKTLAARCRKHFLQWVRNAAATRKTVGGVPVSTWLLDPERPGVITMDQYIEAMTTWGSGRHQWGGFPEVVVLCTMWEAWCVLLQESADGSSWTVRTCVGDMATNPVPICILRTKTEDHWEVVQLPPATITKLQDHYRSARANDRVSKRRRQT